MPNEDTNSLGEFDLIHKYFSRHAISTESTLDSKHIDTQIILGIGDDCALLGPLQPNHVLAITTDMLVEGRHFFAGADPEKLGHKCLAVNLSDLAAMGAKPIAFTLSLALPYLDEPWLKAFSNGLFALADQHHCQLIGGDTTKGPLTISITAFGEVPKNQSLKRANAKVGDDIWISNVIGDARLALGHALKEWQLDPLVFEKVAKRMDTPSPQNLLGISLREIAHSAIDISDGLLGDLKHILKASKLDAQIFIDDIPISSALLQMPEEIRRICTLKGGDDYEICFTASPTQSSHIEDLAKKLNLKLTRIGKTYSPQNTGGHISLIDQHQNVLTNTDASKYFQSFDHFKE